MTEMPASRTTLTTFLKLASLACACLLAAGAHAGLFAQDNRQSPQSSSVQTQAAVQTQASPVNTQASGVSTPDDVARGIESYKRGDFNAAVKALRTTTKKDDTNADAWYYLGLAFVKQYKPKDARKAFETAARLRPNFAAALNGLAYVLVAQNDLGEASVVIQNSLKLGPRNVETHCLLGTVHLRTGSFNRALEEAEESIKLDPSYSQAFLLKSEALVGMISKEINAASDETPDLRAVLQKKVASRFDEAAAALEKFSRMNPQSADAASLAEQIKLMRVYGEMSSAPTSQRTVFSAREVTTKAVILTKPEPLYTPLARQDKITGTVTVRLVLAADGTVKYLFAVNRLPDGLTESALNSARKIKFIPATKDGHPVSQYATIMYNFNIY
jgi:TonB family protein